MRTKSLMMLAALALTAAAAAPAPVCAQEPLIVRLQSSAWLGFSYSAETVRTDGARQTKIVVSSVVAESPAADAGLREGDEIVSVNDLRATSALISSLSSSLEPGDEVELGIRRDGDTRTLAITAAERPDGYSSGDNSFYVFRGDSVVALARSMLDSARVRMDNLRLPDIRVERRGDGNLFVWRDGQLDSLRMWSDSSRPFRFFSDSLRLEFDKWPEVSGIRGFMRVGMRALAGMSLEEVGPMLGEYFGTDSGLLVLEVAPESPAARAGLREGDVILRADGTEVARIGQLREIVAEADGDEVGLTVLRQRREIELTLATDG
jgi:membrane-associated protease RseP (regulator of RpoE activity)